MKAILYVTILLLSMGAVSKEIKDPSHSDLLITYQKLKAKAVDGDVDSQYEIWHFAKNHRPKLDNHLREAFSFITKAGQAGHAGAQFTIGSMYQTGTMREKNSDVALTWLLGAANSGHIKAQLLTANNYANRAVDADDDAEKSKNEKLAVYWYEQSIKENDVLAIRVFGIFLFVLDTFSEKSKNLLERAAKENDSSAMYWLGKMYAHRWSDKRGDIEFNLAHSWLEKAKKNGYKSQEFIDGLNEMKKNYLERIAKENSK
ncbi:MAG: TPR repeat protein [Colwellia sp.]|jgi:TPR repeat protein